MPNHLTNRCSRRLPVARSTTAKRQKGEAESPAQETALMLESDYFHKRAPVAFWARSEHYDGITASVLCT